MAILCYFACILVRQVSHWGGVMSWWKPVLRALMPITPWTYGKLWEYQVRGAGVPLSHILKDGHSGQCESTFTHHAINHETWLSRLNPLHKFLAATEMVNLWALNIWCGPCSHSLQDFCIVILFLFQKPLSTFFLLQGIFKWINIPRFFSTGL